MRTKFNKTISFLAKPHIFFYSCVWLIVLVFFGTLAQRDYGLYWAQQKFFSSFILWVGWIPLPGGYLTMGVLFLTLLAKLVFKSPLKKKSLGTVVTHLGALLLLLGGFLTAITTQEGAMVLAEGDRSNQFEKYFEKELHVGKEKSADNIVFQQKWIKKGNILAHKKLPFKVEVLNFYENSSFVKRQESDPENVKGFLKIFQIFEIPREKQAEKNRPAVIFQITGSQEKTNGLYAVFEGMPIQQNIRFSDDVYPVKIDSEKIQLPFEVELIDFEKKMHPATGIPKSFKSEVKVHDNGVEQRKLIEMNEPLRYRGYTFYQASYLEGTPKETTVLAVVKNTGRLFPYISSIVMCIGVLIHLLLMSSKLFVGGRRADKGAL